VWREAGDELMRPLSSSSKKMKQRKKITQLEEPTTFQDMSALCFEDWLRQ
jgi:hypothetical protein